MGCRAGRGAGNVRRVPLPITLPTVTPAVAGYAAVTGAAILAYRRTLTSPLGGRRALVAAPLLIAYAALAIAVPLHLGFTHAVPAGPRWWLLLVVWAGFAVPAYAADRLAGGTLLVSAIAVVGLTAASLLGLASGFVLLVVPLLALLMLLQAALAAVLRARAAPPWLTALTGSLVVAWPIATTLPLA